MTPATPPEPAAEAGCPRPAVRGPRTIIDTRQTTCCIVGGGPAGVILALLLARAGVPVELLEAHGDFDRQFRGDSIHPGVMDVLDQIGVAEGVLGLPHTKLPTVALPGPAGPVAAVDFRRLNTRFPFITMLPQASFLDYITAQAARYPGFRLTMGAHVEELIEDGGVVRGVRYRDRAGWHEVRALLTVGADGRGSRTRKLGGFDMVSTSPPMDILWFQLPRRPDDTEQTFGRSASGAIVAVINRFDYWQIGYVIPKGSYQQLRAAGLARVRAGVAELLPEWADRLETLTDWREIGFLSVESGRVRRWYRRGMLLIGDAAHTMSPVGGVGINYAIQDAVEAANVLVEPLRARRLSNRHLRAVQRRRELPTRAIQWLQSQIQQRVLAPVLSGGRAAQLPPAAVQLLNLPLVRDLPARIIGFGIWPVRLDPRLATARPRSPTP